MDRSRQGLAHGGIASALRPYVVVGAIATVEAIPLVLVAYLVPAPFLLPILSIIFLAAGGILALVACCIRADRNSDRVTVWDVAGACVLLGFAAGIFSSPQDVVAAFAIAPGG
jgi:hypothetical protein